MRITTGSFTDRSPYWSLQIMHIYLHSLCRPPWSILLCDPEPATSSVPQSSGNESLGSRRSPRTSTLERGCKGNSPPHNPSVGKYVIHFGSFDPFFFPLFFFFFFNWMTLTSLCVLRGSPVCVPRARPPVWPLWASSRVNGTVDHAVRCVR